MLPCRIAPLPGASAALARPVNSIPRRLILTAIYVKQAWSFCGQLLPLLVKPTVDVGLTSQCALSLAEERTYAL